MVMLVSVVQLVRTKSNKMSVKLLLTGQLDVLCVVFHFHQFLEVSL